MKLEPRRKFIIRCRMCGWLLLAALTSAANAGSFTPLLPLPAPEIRQSTTAFPEARYKVRNLVDGNPKSEYASKEAGTNTSVEFDFGAPVEIAAFRHVDRDDPATVETSELDFSDAEDHLIQTVAVRHVNRPGGETLLVLPAPVRAQRVKWRVTKSGSDSYQSVGGAEISFLKKGEAEPYPARDEIQAHALPVVEAGGTAGLQPIHIIVSHPYAEPVEAKLKLGEGERMAVTLQPGQNAVDYKAAMVSSTTTNNLMLEVEGKEAAQAAFERKPVRAMTVYILPHSHTDIGYTEIQGAVEKKQANNLLQGIAAARRTADYPAGARFVWNVEVLWAADQFLHQMDAQQRADFVDAVKQGQVVLNGMYVNELTGLCRPEELVQLFRFATKMRELTGAPIDTAMISDVPGYTWGTVTALSQAGIKYFTTAPNYFDRIGSILKEWENKPFYWEGPDGKTRVLVWIPFYGYAMSHVYNKMSLKLVEDFLAALDKHAYPYDVSYLRWSGHGDNAEPDPAICDFIKDWNAKYLWPKFVISGPGEAFRALEQRYGDKLPVVRGDWTPYWEDGAGSSARETAMNRQSSDRLVQAETAFAMLNPQAYSAADFENAWKHVLLYSEHTWGAWCSIDQPERKETTEQWAVKKSYAEAADQESRDLLAKALGGAMATANAGIEVANTLSWPRTDLVTLPPELSKAGDVVKDEGGNEVASQRLSGGELVFRADNVPAFGTKRYVLSAGELKNQTGAKADGETLDDGVIHVRVDKVTGGIVELTAKGIKGNFADTSGGEELNDYDYLIGDKLGDLKHNGPVRISVGEKGPLVASLIVESGAPGCKTLRRELRVTADRGYVEVMNLVDKERLKTGSYRANSGKESVNFAFPFNVPGGEMLVDIPLGAMRPERDQMPSACKNWVEVGRWVDVSNPEMGITWVSLDAPLIEVGEISARLLNSQTNPEVWRKKIGLTQKLYSWAMNNHWGTNYRAYQEGPVVFRFVLRPHRKFDAAEATRFSTGFSEPLLARASTGEKARAPLLQVSPPDVVVTALKPSDDGGAWVVRLFGASGKTVSAKLDWGRRTPKAVYLSDTSEKAGAVAGNTVSVPGYGLVTVRAEFE